MTTPAPRDTRSLQERMDDLADLFVELEEQEAAEAAAAAQQTPA